MFNSTVISLLEFIPFTNDELVCLKKIIIKSCLFTFFKYFFHIIFFNRWQLFYHLLPIFIKVLVWLAKQFEFCCTFVCKRYVLISLKKITFVYIFQSAVCLLYIYQKLSLYLNKFSHVVLSWFILFSLMASEINKLMTRVSIVNATYNRERDRGKNINFNLTKKTTQIMMKENLGMIVSYIVCNNFF